MPFDQSLPCCTATASDKVCPIWSLSQLETEVKQLQALTLIRVFVLVPAVNTDKFSSDDQKKIRKTLHVLTCPLVTTCSACFLGAGVRDSSVYRGLQCGVPSLLRCWSSGCVSRWIHQSGILSGSR